MTTRTVTQAHERYLADLCAHREKLLEEAKRMEEQAKEIQERIERGKTFAEEYQEWEKGSRKHKATSHDHVRPEDLAGDMTMRAAAEVIARLSNGLLHYREAAQIMIEAGRTSSDVGSAAATLYKILNESDEWEWVEAGAFRLSRFGGQDEALTNESVPD